MAPFLNFQYDIDIDIIICTISLIYKEQPGLEDKKWTIATNLATVELCTRKKCVYMIKFKPSNLNVPVDKIPFFIKQPTFLSFWASLCKVCKLDFLIYVINLNYIYLRDLPGPPTGGNLISYADDGTIIAIGAKNHIMCKLINRCGQNKSRLM